MCSLTFWFLLMNLLQHFARYHVIQMIRWNHSMVRANNFINCCSQPLTYCGWSLGSNTKSQMRITYTSREIPRSPIARKSVVMGTVWLFKPSSRHSFAQLCTSRMVERFGKDESNWEHVELEIMSDEGDSISKASLTDIVADSMVVEDDQMSISSYEIERQKRIDENRLALLQLVSSQHTTPCPTRPFININQGRPNLFLPH